MLFLFRSQSEDFTVECPMCRSVKMLKKTDVDKKKEQKAIYFRCTCGNRFYKKIVRKDFSKIDIISAIANFDVEVIWYKIKPLLIFFGNNKYEKISLV